MGDTMCEDGLILASCVHVLPEQSCSLLPSVPLPAQVRRSSKLQWSPSAVGTGGASSGALPAQCCAAGGPQFPALATWLLVLLAKRAGRPRRPPGF